MELLLLALAILLVARRSPDAVTPAQAIERGLSYLRRHPSDVSALIVLDYLQRRYALPAGLAFEATRPPGADDPRFTVWGRFVGRDRLVDDRALGALGPSAGIEEIVMHALYCDRFPLPASYGGLLRDLAERGGYELTHAVLALKLARDHGCALDGFALAQFEERARRRLRVLIERTPEDTRFEDLDVRYEALAILQDFLVDREVSLPTIARLLAEQQPDGGWRPAADQPSAPHPTVMAVWALLTSVHPGAAEIPFARR